jgi:hypothetical protein
MKLDLAKASHSSVGVGNTTPPVDTMVADGTSTAANTVVSGRALVDAGTVTRTTGSRRGIAPGMKRAASFHSAQSPKSTAGDASTR